MRRALKKPRELTTRKFINGAEELNEMLLKFPRNQDGTPVTALPIDERINNYHFSVPRKFRQVMQEQGWDPLEHSIDDFIDVCETRIEELETHDAEAKPVKKKSKKEPHNHPNKDSKNKKTYRIKSKYCSLHKWGDHATHECETLNKALEAKEKYESGKFQKKAYKRTISQANRTPKRK